MVRRLYSIQDNQANGCDHLPESARGGGGPPKVRPNDESCKPERRSRCKDNEGRKRYHNRRVVRSVISQGECVQPHRTNKQANCSANGQQDDDRQRKTSQCVGLIAVRLNSTWTVWIRIQINDSMQLLTRRTLEIMRNGEATCKQTRKRTATLACIHGSSSIWAAFDS